MAIIRKRITYPLVLVRVPNSQPSIGTTFRGTFGDEIVTVLGAVFAVNPLVARLHERPAPP